MHPFLALIVALMMICDAGAVTSQSFRVSATVVPGCSVSTGTGGRFGTLDFGTRNGVDNTPVSTSFDGGQNYSSVRRMTRSGGTEVVGYRLYSSSSLAANSEIGVNQAIPITYTNSNNIALPLFGVALLTGFSLPGTYSDQLTVTLSW